MPNPAKVSVAITSWNGRSHLETCLPALEDQRPCGLDWEVLVLDNGSDDGTADWVGRAHPRVRVVESSENLGFCAGNNRLVAEADGDLIALLNNDARPRPDWLAGLVDGLLSAPPDVVAVSGKILDWEGARLDFGRGLLVFDGHAFQLDFRRPLDSARVPEPGAELPFACGANMLVRREAFRAAGGFDEAYFAYLEDVDLGWRLWSRGGRIVSAPEGVVHHRSGATGGVLGNAERGFLIERNAFLTAYKNYEAGLFEAVLPLILTTLMNRARALVAADVEPGKGAAGALDLVSAVRRFGLRTSIRKGLGRLRGAASRPAKPPSDRTQAQLRAIDAILTGLDLAAAGRAEVQSRRSRSDREYFERFPVYVVPTYPGDAELFASAAFAALWPDELPAIHAGLDEI